MIKLQQVYNRWQVTIDLDGTHFFMGEADYGDGSSGSDAAMLRNRSAHGSCEGAAYELLREATARALKVWDSTRGQQTVWLSNEHATQI
jgi:hypothetical protein